MSQTAGVSELHSAEGLSALATLSALAGLVTSNMGLPLSWAQTMRKRAWEREKVEPGLLGAIDSGSSVPNSSTKAS